MKYSTTQITNSVHNLLDGGNSKEDALDLYLCMHMQNDLSEKRPNLKGVPSPSDIHKQLLGNGVIDEQDILLYMSKGTFYPVELLTVKLSPTCSLQATPHGSSLLVVINGKRITTITLTSYTAEDIAMWLIRQKQNLDRYLDGWEEVFDNANKKIKSNHMAYLAVRAIFTDAMKDYPDLQYEFCIQKRRVRIVTTIPDTHLGVVIHAWWGSYRERLPRQIESLKILLEAHSKSSLKDFVHVH